MTEYGMLIDYEWCTGCHSCETACQMEHHLPVGQFGIKLNEIGPFEYAPTAGSCPTCRCPPTCATSAPSGRRRASCLPASTTARHSVLRWARSTSWPKRSRRRGSSSCSTGSRRRAEPIGTIGQQGPARRDDVPALYRKRGWTTCHADTPASAAGAAGASPVRSTSQRSASAAVTRTLRRPPPASNATWNCPACRDRAKQQRRSGRPVGPRSSNVPKVPIVSTSQTARPRA